MAENVTLNSPTSSGAVIGTDEVVINTATVQVQRMKIGYGSEGAWNNTSSDAPFPIYVQPGTSTIGSVVLGAGTATAGTVLVGSNTATIGTVNVASGGGTFLKTSTGGTIPADTTSGLMVKYGSVPTMVLGAGTATIGTMLIDAGTATIGTVVLGAGTATIGTVAANFASGSGFELRTSTGGSVPADTVSGLAVKFVNTPTVAANFASGAGFFIKTSTGGTVPADTTSGLAVKYVNVPTMAMGAGTATIGTVFIQTASTLNTQLQAGTATIGTANIQTATTLNTQLQAGTATIGTVNIQTATTVNVGLATTQAILMNTQPSLATGDFGPKTINVTASGNTALVSAAGANSSIYVTSIRVTNTATTPGHIGFSDGATRDLGTAAANGGGWLQYYNPPWKCPGNTALNAVATAAVDVDVTVHFYNGAT